MRNSARRLPAARRFPIRPISAVRIRRSSLALRSLAALTLPLLSLFAAGSPAAAQNQPQGPQSLDETGFVEAASGNALTAKLGKNPASWVISVAPGAKVLVTGTAEPSYLHSGLSIKFTTEFDKKGTALPKEIEQIDIFTAAGKGSVGVFDSTNAQSPDKPVRVPEDGKSYEIRTKVGSFKPETNELTVTVNGKKVVAKTSPSVAIKVESEDIGLAQEGDSVAVKGMYNPQQRPNPQAGQPGYVTAESVTVTLSKPLAGSKKRGKTPLAKAPRGKAAAPDAAPEVPNPFSK